MDSYSIVFLKLAVGIMALVIQINILGKGNLAPISAMDQIQNYVLGGIIGGVLYNASVSVLQFVMVLIIWTFLVLLLKFVKNHNYLVKAIVDGKPIVIVRRGELQMDNILRAGLSANELMFKLRSAGIDEIQALKLAIVEQNGQLTLTKYGEEDVKYPLIQDGQINYELLDLLDHDVAWLEEQVSKQYKNIAIADIYLGEFIHGHLVLHLYHPDEAKPVDK
ncbi:DUF421 domain-containing protein [Weissella halotolerans]|uniref:Membrane protein yetF n=1 Tax=Weissella halotolerans DSM 20190 TaxID=1123500 RepID=A0A0R2G9B6_9LACO|nr:DUF421 domain-containing protein [Weissella halotolerans]KRN33245.1 hypothetical protein IV68_GL000043 [Weissella halotolerans DSM 20190]